MAVLSVQLMSAQEVEVGSVMLPTKVNFGGQDLSLNGAGIRKKAMVLKLYSGGLYLAKEMHNADAVINTDETMAIKLHITSGFVSSEAMMDAVNEGFDKSLDGKTGPLQTEIKKFISFFSDEIVEDNVFDITYQKGTGVVVYKNDKELGTIEGMDFKKALFGIWLGDEPADKKLKKAMLDI